MQSLVHKHLTPWNTVYVRLALTLRAESTIAMVPITALLPHLSKVLDQRPTDVENPFNWFGTTPSHTALTTRKCGLMCKS